MANLTIKNGQSEDVFLKASGDGSNANAHVLEHLESNSAEIKAHLNSLLGAISTEVTLLALYNAFGQASAVPWTGTGNGSAMQVLKNIALGVGTTSGTPWNGSGPGDLVELLMGIYGLLTGALTTDLVDEGGVAISEANPLQVQIGQLLASQDSVQANQYGLGSDGDFVPIKVPTKLTFNISGSLGANATAVLVPAQAAGIRSYTHHVRISMEVAANVPTRMSLMDGAGGQVLTRFRMEPGKNTDLWFPNGNLVTSPATALVVRNDAASALTALEWGVDYSTGA